MLEDIEERTIELINNVNGLWAPDTYLKMKDLENKFRKEFIKNQQNIQREREAAEHLKRQ